MSVPASIPARAERSRTRPAARELFEVALVHGAVGFGGGYSVLASLRNALVERRRWLSEREFVNAATVAQMLPGGAAANALAYTGLRFAGLRGALAAYAGFVLPGFLLTLALAMAYVRWGAAPDVEAVLGGFNAAVVGVVAALTIQLVRTGVGRLWQMGIAAGALLMSLAGGASSGEVAGMGVGAGLLVDLGLKRARLMRLRSRRRAAVTAAPVALPEDGRPLPTPRPEPDEAPYPAIAVGLGTAAGLHAFGLDARLLELTLVFFRTGLGAYGGGFAVIPHLQAAVQTGGWMEPRQFADAVAIGKLTPGPVLLMATFIGYVVGGLPAALASTGAVLAAPLLLVVSVGTFLDRARSRRPVRAALRGLTPAVAGLMAAAALSLGRGLDDAGEVGIAAAVALTVHRFPVNPAVMLALGGAARLGLKAAGL
jgi:chromate transporter